MISKIQEGLREGFSTIQHILALQVIINKKLMDFLFQDTNYWTEAVRLPAENGLL